jgi:chaperonin cofactor prefoldin
MSKYNNALQEARRLLGETEIQEEVSPQIQSLLNQKASLQKRIDNLDKQRKPLILQMQDINKKLTMLNQDINA